MADSDNTTTLPLVTGRTVAARTANAMVGSQPTEVARKILDEDQSADAAVTVWREWQEAFKLTERQCRDQQRLERKLAETVGFPRATILQSNGESLTLHCLKEIGELPGADSIDATIRAKAEADLAAHQIRWDAAAEEIGYSSALRAEREAADRAEELLEVLSETPATTLAGVAAKLDAVLRVAQPSESDAEFPWPLLRATIRDIARISRPR
ncbi:hypothetical protein [Mesorhizobium sp. B1-1-8]|uniref:hypothetical protein n=1 Tax=Mesorhizobium sp. B1-1-8 TaxID=2589976 RepID=UPI0011287623|nr:hypothetical protein [Mesorhizobium sp. B1-1-8]UCI10366.1 hypothetical protein FJ974_28995 [Mesorhizobium sp. B1-1-8]UCI10384.1 hypothetical protein FJ974_29115 [Mesorhizobium sp. B1-1-8]